MGTNYYGRIKPTEKQLLDIIFEVIKGNIYNAKSLIEDFEQIHIGKQSVGWKFLFDKNKKKWTSFQEYKDWVNQFEIFSEYGEQISPEEFWRKVESKQKYKSSVGQYCTNLDGYDFSTSNDFC